LATFNLLLKIAKRNPQTFAIFGDATWHHLIHWPDSPQNNPKNLLKFIGSTWPYLIHSKKIATINPRTIVTFGNATWHQLIVVKNLKPKTIKLLPLLEVPRGTI
jgi:hypothetical protein